jgi:hypothetical protein
MIGAALRGIRSVVVCSADGLDGLPAVQIGRSIRIPTVALERLAEPDPTPSVASLRPIDAG